ncbi:hypothetical protein DUI87_17290 [Hirundo rustica rustica]|uniref:M-phase phosphoprotein 9 n=1 Tax=Hirundo rustica rustica TaxID=333673 RepID=A0A3M0KF58_HIRRU|nr:hypothetical protein DUI87_17290 [Hirundo rustica rustica]
MGMSSEAFEEQESLVSQLGSSEAGSQPEAREARQECAGSEASMNSGYGSLSASELSPAQPGHGGGTDCTQQSAHAAGLQADAGSAPKPGELVAKKPEENPSSGTGDVLAFPAGFEREADEDHRRGKKAGKSLTSWAQKLRQTQPKRAPADEVCVNSMQENERMKRLPLESTNLTDAALPPYTFYLNQPKESPNSIVSEASGLSYWKLDEKEMYHTLPENFRSELPGAFSTKVPPVQILTLDPTLHMKPGQQNQGRSFFHSPEDSAPFSPDSMAEPGFPSQCDTDSFSQTSHSSQLDDSPTHPASSRAVHLDLWRNHPFQGANRASSPFPVAYRDADKDNSLSAEEEETLTLTPSSVTQCADSSVPDYSLSLASAEDPVVMSKIRQNLREKHARHIADLRAYYDSEIQSLKQQLESSHRSAASEDLRKINQSLADRCDQLDAALNEASARIKVLENKNNLLEKQVADWRERFYAISDNSKVLQERLEEMRTAHKEKDNAISRLKSRLRELEEAFEKAYKLSDNKNTRLQEENKMFQNLLGEYESLGKEHERVKDTLNTTENKLLDANTEISDLKRTILKLEAQLKQVEHENALKLRHISENRLGTSCANKLGTPDVSRRKWLIPGAEYSIFTGQPLEGQESPKDNRLEETYIPSRFDILLDDLEAGATSTLQHNNPRKRLQFRSLDDVEGLCEVMKKIRSPQRMTFDSDELHEDLFPK